MPSEEIMKIAIEVVDAFMSDDESVVPEGLGKITCVCGSQGTWEQHSRPTGPRPEGYVDPVGEPGFIYWFECSRCGYNPGWRWTDAVGNDRFL